MQPSVLLGSLGFRDNTCLLVDYLTKVAVRNKASKDIKVSEIMTERSKLMTVDPNHTTMDAMTMMIKHNFRHVPVVSIGTTPNSSALAGPQKEASPETCAKLLLQTTFLRSVVVLWTRLLSA